MAVQDKLAGIARAVYQERATQTDQVAAPVLQQVTQTRQKREILPFLEGKAMKIAFKRGAIEVNIK